jgi:uracil-DNA glycosylase family 4
MIMSKREAIERIYSEVHEYCSSLEGFSQSQVRRRVLVDSLDSKLFLIGQAPGERTQRVSGIPYTFPNGKLSITGRKLEKHLGSIGFTLIPDNCLSLVYSSDIAQYYPGKTNGRDNPPQEEQIKRFSPWLAGEIETIRPEVLILLGSVAAHSFFKVHGTDNPRFSSFLDRDFEVEVRGTKYKSIVLPHPASSYPDYTNLYRRAMKRISGITQPQL